MKLENLKDFEWYNEPENVIFADHEMRIVARAKTDFWQSRHHGVSKDDGHFFYQRRRDDFECLIVVAAATGLRFRQCGLMVRVDALNWFKISFMAAQDTAPAVGHCLTQGGCSDWVSVPLEAYCPKMWYKVVRCGPDFVVFYSSDGERFVRLRQFSFISDCESVAVGAYFCSPDQTSAESTLLDATIES
jgi:hypothetical protein